LVFDNNGKKAHGNKYHGREKIKTVKKPFYCLAWRVLRYRHYGKDKCAPDGMGNDNR
jgi:hypothetical protein